jgi:hypothetical protein
MVGILSPLKCSKDVQSSPAAFAFGVDRRTDQHDLVVPLIADAALTVPKKANVGRGGHAQHLLENQNAYLLR